MDHSASNTTSLFSLFGKLGVFILLGVASSRPAQAESIAVPHQNKICKQISHNFSRVYSASYSIFQIQSDLQSILLKCINVRIPILSVKCIYVLIQYSINTFQKYLILILFQSIFGPNFIFFIEFLCNNFCRNSKLEIIMFKKKC